MTPRIEARGVTVRFGATAALDGVDLAVEPGEVLAVLGPSGSGKSTLLRAIAGLEPVDDGSVSIDGVDAAGVPPHRRGVGMMFQQPALFPHLDVGANVAFGLRMQGRRGAEVDGRVGELLELVGLPGTERRDVSTLSGGEQQRVALARALAPAPTVLLLDEPFGSLDRPRRDRLVVELRSLFTQLGLTVVAVTHDQTEAFSLADRLALLDHGRLLQSGPVAQVWGEPRTARAAELLGLTNLAEVSVVGGRLQSPWGDLGPGTAAAAGGRALVRPEAVRLDRGGPVEGIVVAATFSGARARVRIDVAGAPPLEADLPASERPPLGARVGFSIDPAGVAVLPT